MIFARTILACLFALIVAPAFAGSHSAATQETVMTLLRGFGALDVEAQLDTYAEDATVITRDRVYRGKDEIRDYIEGFVAEFSQEGISMETDMFLFEGKIGLVIWSGDSPQNSYDFASDTYVVEDGKIVSHTFAAKVTPK